MEVPGRNHMKSLTTRLSVLLATGALVAAQVVMPVHAAFAESHNAAPAGNNGSVKINDQPSAQDSGNQTSRTSIPVSLTYVGTDTTRAHASQPSHSQAKVPQLPTNLFHQSDHRTSTSLLLLAKTATHYRTKRTTRSCSRVPQPLRATTSK